MKTQGKAEPKKVCFSYKRWSSTAQGEEGRSSDFRQTIAARVAAERGWHFDPNLSIKDDGLSAYHGKNIGEKGGLGSLIKALKAGTFPKGRVMVIDEMSRLTRLGLKKAQDLLGDLLESGLELYIDRPMAKHITVADLDDPMAVTLFVWQIWANHEYSKKLSGNIATAWRKKKLEFSENGKPYRHKPPGWLKWNGEGYEPVPDKVKSLKRLFELAIEGNGVRTICRRLNEEHCPSIGSYKNSNGWALNTALRILTSGEVIGINPNFTPPQKMYPAVIDEPIYYKAKAMMDTRKTNKYYGRTGNAENLFMGVAKCKCGRSMVLHKFKRYGHNRKNFGLRGGYGARGGKQEYSYLWCSGWDGGYCDCKQIRYDWVEESFSAIMEDRTFIEPFITRDTKEASALEELQGKLAETKTRLAKYTADYEAEPSNALRGLMAKMEAEQKRLATEVERHQTLTLGKVPFEEAWRDFAEAVNQDWDNPEFRIKLRNHIRNMVEKLVIDVHSKTYEVVLRNSTKPIKVECFEHGYTVDGKWFYNVDGIATEAA